MFSVGCGTQNHSNHNNPECLPSPTSFHFNSREDALNTTWWEVITYHRASGHQSYCLMQLCESCRLFGRCPAHLPFITHHLTLLWICAHQAITPCRHLANKSVECVMFFFLPLCWSDLWRKSCIFRRGKNTPWTQWSVTKVFWHSDGWWTKIEHLRRPLS